MRIGFISDAENLTMKQKEAILEYLKSINDLENNGLLKVHHGDTQGADEDFHDIARQAAAIVFTHPPKNNRAFKIGNHTYEPQEFYQRYDKMLMKVGVLIVALKERGSIKRQQWVVIKRMEAAGKLIKYVDPNGIWGED